MITWPLCIPRAQINILFCDRCCTEWLNLIAYSNISTEALLPSFHLSLQTWQHNSDSLSYWSQNSQICSEWTNANSDSLGNKCQIRGCNQLWLRRNLQRQSARQPELVPNLNWWNVDMHWGLLCSFDSQWHLGKLASRMKLLSLASWRLPLNTKQMLN